MDDKFINDFFVGMCDDICLEIIFDLHRAIRTNTLSATELFKIQPIDDKIQSRDNTKVLAVKDTIKPNTAANAQLTSLCPICSNIIGSKRFAPHLEKCMHGGRKRISVPADLPSSSSTNSVSSSSGHVKKKRATRTLIFRILVNNNGVPFENQSRGPCVKSAEYYSAKEDENVSKVDSRSREATSEN